MSVSYTNSLHSNLELELIAGLFFERVFGTQAGQVVLPLAVAISAAGNVMVTTFSHVSKFTRQPNELH
jgi:hypothetical protein